MLLFIVYWLILGVLGVGISWIEQGYLIDRESIYRPGFQLFLIFIALLGGPFAFVAALRDIDARK